MTGNCKQKHSSTLKKLNIHIFLREPKSLAKENRQLQNVTLKIWTFVGPLGLGLGLKRCKHEAEVPCGGDGQS